MTDLNRILLEPERFAQVVRDSPLVSFDLVVLAPDDTVLVGWRSNEPARHTWFVPGGRICKGETLDQAFRRISITELGTEYQRQDARSLGVFQHFYNTNFRDDEGYGTHYIVLAHELRLDALPESLPDALPDQQHARYRWMSVKEIRADPDVHANVKAYFPIDPR